MVQFVYDIREYLKAIYAKFDIYILSLVKFLIAFILLKMTNSELGFLSRINDTAIVLLVSLVCAILPWGVTAAMVALFVLGHFYALSLELAGVTLVLFVIMFCLYLRFGAGDSIYMLLTLLLFTIKLPYLAPILAGLTAGGVTVAVPVAFGVIIYYFIGFASGNAEFLSSGGTEAMLERFKFIVDNMLQNKLMFLMMIAFVVTVVLAYTIRKLAIDYAWVIATIVSTAVYVVLMLIGKAMLDIEVSAGAVIFGSIAAAAIMIFAYIFIFAVDYKRKVNVQFEDDDYVYYVKAVPKVKADIGNNGKGLIETWAKRKKSTENKAKPEKVRRPDGTGTHRPASAGMQRPTSAGMQRTTGEGMQRPTNAGTHRPAGVGAQRPTNAGAQRPTSAGVQRTTGEGTHRPINARMYTGVERPVAAPKPSEMSNTQKTTE